MYLKTGKCLDARVVKIQPIVGFVTRVEVVWVVFCLEPRLLCLLFKVWKREKDRVGHGRSWHEEEWERASWVHVRLRKDTPFFWCNLCLCFRPLSPRAMAPHVLSFVWCPSQSWCCPWCVKGNQCVLYTCSSTGHQASLRPNIKKRKLTKDE